MNERTEPTKRELKRAARTEQLMTTAMDMIADMGLDGFSMHKLAAAMKLTVGALYRYFPSKAALIAALENQVISQMDEVLKKAVAAVDNTEEQPDLKAVCLARVVAAAYAYRDRLHTAPQQMRLIGGLMSNPQPQLNPADALVVLSNMLGILKTVSDAMDAAVSEDALAPGSSMERALVTWASLRGVAETRKLSQHMPDVFDEASLFRCAVSSLLIGWGADTKVVDRAFIFVLDTLKETS
jgi:AcrR family transcriptional regulator